MAVAGCAIEYIELLDGQVPCFQGSDVPADWRMRSLQALKCYKIK